MYFSVRTPTKILGKVYQPCICYKVPRVLEKTVELLVQSDRAAVYDHEVFFQNGKLIETETKEEAPVATEKKAKKNKKKVETESVVDTF